MGRETKILLGLLGLLAGVFIGVLSMKLLVPRPPTGAGPDVHADVASGDDHELVPPPDFTAAKTPAPDDTAAGAAPPADPYASHASRFGRPASAPDSASIPEPPAAAPPPRQDPFLSRTAFEDAEPPATATGAAAPAAAPYTPAAEPDPLPPAAPPARVASPAAAAAGGYVAQPGDSWWSLAERAYGDGRLYRALFAWNRALEPRVSLVPGTPLEIPPLDRLRMAWPALTPKP